MGCVSSKVMTKTGSYREELSRSLKKRYGDFPALQELLIPTSKKLNDDRYVVVSDVDENKGNQVDYCTDDVKRLDHETINAWDLMADLEEEQVDRHEERASQHEVMPDDGANHTIKRSRSFCPSSDHKINEGNNGVHARARSFHTVEEYDAILMERNGWANHRQESKWEDKLEDFLTDVTLVRSPCSSLNLSNACGDDKSEAVQKMDPESHQTRESEHSTPMDVPRMKRAKDLTSLEIPSTIEFPVAVNFKVTSEEYNGKLVSYGNYDYYATPKFGSFDVPVQNNNYKCELEEREKEKCVFDPELLSSFEVAMEQLQVEEEFLLNQINNKISK